jgi:plasmid stabilization system protein ParE
VPKTHVRWSAEAIGDIESIEEFIGRDSPRYGAIVAERIVQSVDLLEDHPNAGRIGPEIDRPEFRELIRDSYRIVYLIRDEGIEILTVFRA